MRGLQFQKSVTIMIQKWTQKEDRQLVRLVKKYGTGDWSVIREHFSSKRSKDSVVKRWHFKLKEKADELDLESQKEDSSKKVENVKKTPHSIRKEKEKMPVKTHPITRSEKNVITKLLDNEVILKRPEITSKYQRLRIFLDQNNPEPSQPSPLQAQKSRLQKTAKKMEEDEEQGESSEQIEDEQESSSLPSKYQIEWNKPEDQKLKNLVINEAITDWQKLGNELGCTAKEVKKRWNEQIYPIITHGDKVGGALKYSNEEDAVLAICRRNGMTWEKIMKFLPGRSQYSVEARWRRAARPQIDVEASKNKHYMMRQLLKKILDKRRSWKEPFEEKEESVRL